jgi:hypothetical protein
MRRSNRKPKLTNLMISLQPCPAMTGCLLLDQAVTIYMSDQSIINFKKDADLAVEKIKSSIKSELSKFLEKYPGSAIWIESNVLTQDIDIKIIGNLKYLSLPK